MVVSMTKHANSHHATLRPLTHPLAQPRFQKQTHLGFVMSPPYSKKHLEQISESGEHKVLELTVKEVRNINEESSYSPPGRDKTKKTRSACGSQILRMSVGAY